MDTELVETLQLILRRYGDRTKGSVFIPMIDFPWYSERNGQLTRLHMEGYITKPRFYDNGAEITLTQQGRDFIIRDTSEGSLGKEQIYKILVSLKQCMKMPDDSFGYEKRKANGIIQRLQDEGLIAGANFAVGKKSLGPLIVWLEQAYITVKGLEFIDQYEKAVGEQGEIDLTHEFISACAKIADNTASYGSFDEDGLNREIRNLLDSAIARFGYTISDQTQQGLGKTEKKAGELDIRINKNSLPVAIYEGLIHRTTMYRNEHIKKAIERYNLSGCKAIYIVEFSKNVKYSAFWDDASENVKALEILQDITEVDTELLGVRMLSGNFKWEGKLGNFYYIGVNCFS